VAGEHRAAFVYEDVMSRHVLSDGHTMRPVRLQYTNALLRAYGAFDAPGALVIEPRPASVEELTTFHEEFYVEIVQRLSNGESYEQAHRFGFSDGGDNPIYKGMYQAALLSTGASVQAAELVAAGTVPVAFAPAGGLHHAMAGHASGFCIFNDPVIAINALRKQGKRVVYIDIDAHHGDGVQAAYYADADVMTISIHEGGRWIFPGTGDVMEVGRGVGVGYSVNVPLFPYTGDEVFLDAFDAVVPPLVEAFKPDVIATQLGVDTYVHDPLTHLALTSHGYEAAIERLRALGIPWLAFGGGGYDLDAVPRCWAMAYAIMLGLELPNELPEGADVFLESPTLRDGEVSIEADVQEQTRTFAQERIDEVRERIFPFHGLS
jgi:acetoin utilization protein AcuC